MINQSQIEDLFKNHMLINSNRDEFKNCYFKCVNKNNILDLYDNRDNEILFGRRGTGKTTMLKALYYYANVIKIGGPDIKCFYVDMEDIVPNDYVLDNSNKETIIVEMYRKLLVNITNQFMNLWCDVYDNRRTNGWIKYKNILDNIGNEIDKLSEIVLFGDKKVNKINEVEQVKTLNAKIDGYSTSNTFGINFGDLKMNKLGAFSLKHKKTKLKTAIEKTSVTKEIEYVLNTELIKKFISNIINLFKFERLIICIDEFTLVDRGHKNTIQPAIAQLIKDTFFRIENVSMKITSLWNNTEMQMRQVNSVRVGIELGEDIKRGLDLDSMFFEDSYNKQFFEDMLLNTYKLYSGVNNTNDRLLVEYIIDELFTSREIFDLLICGTQGIPRVFSNLLVSAIEKKRRYKRKKIDAEIVYNCIVENFTQLTRRKLPYSGSDIIDIFDNFVENMKSRFILISINDYEKYKMEINGLLDNNYMHQYPSEKVNRRIRNKFKVYLVHYGNYLETIGIKEWRKIIGSQKNISIYPKLTKDIIENPTCIQLNLNEINLVSNN